MNRTRLVVVLLLLGSLGVAQSTAGGAAEIEQLQVKRDGSDVTIQVVLSGSVKPSVEVAINPDRLVLVLPETLSDAKQKRFPLGANGVRAVRIGLNSANPPVTRLVVDLDSAHPYTLSADGKSITLRVQPSENAEVVARHVQPAPAATAPLLGVFRRKPQAPAIEPMTTAQAPIPVPPKLPPINFPEQPASNPQTANNAPALTTPSAAHPKLGSLQQGTVFPGMGTPGSGAVPPAQGTAAKPTNAVTVQTAESEKSSGQGSAPLVVKAAPASTATTAAAPSTITVTVGDAKNAAPVSSNAPPVTQDNIGSTTATSASENGAAVSVSGPEVSVAQQQSGVPTTSSAGAANITAKVLSAAVTPPPAEAPAAAGAPVQNPVGLPSAAAPSPGKVSTENSQTANGSEMASSTNAPTPAASSTPAAVQLATKENPPGPNSVATDATQTAASTTNSAPVPTSDASQGATVANPVGTSETAAASTIAMPQGASVANPLGLAPGEKLEMAPIEVVEPEKDAATEVKADATEDSEKTEKNDSSITVVAASEPSFPTALALRAAHPDFRTAFHVKYVAAGAAYLDGGRSAGLSEGMKLVVRETPTGSATAAAQGSADHLVAELEVTSVAESSAVTDIHTPTRDVKPGDLAYLSVQDEQKLVQQSTLSASRKYPTVISFTADDTLDEEARVQVPRPPMPSVNRARGRVGVDYMGTSFHGSTGGTNTDVGLVARLDMTRIGGTYWNASGYWRGRLTANNYSGTSTTIQDLLNRTYHLSMTYDNPNSPWVAGFGRMYLPWATSLDTIDGGYFGRRLGHVTTLGIFAGSTPDPTSWSYSPDRRIGGMFVNFEGGSYDNLRFTSTSGVALSTIHWKIDRPFVFLENGLYYKRYVAIYDSLQADSPVGYQPGGSPGAGVGRNFLTVRLQPHERIEFDANYSYFRDLPTFDPALIGTSLLDKYLFQGFSGGVRLEVLKNVWVYTNLGRSSRSGDTSSSLNQLYGLTLGRIPWIQVRADAHYARFNSSFGNGKYESISLSRSIGDSFRLELLGGQQTFVSSLSSNSDSKFVTSNAEMNFGVHYFLQGGFTVNRGVVQNYDQWLFSLGYRFDSRRAKGQ